MNGNGKPKPPGPAPRPEPRPTPTPPPPQQDPPRPAALDYPCSTLGEARKSAIKVALDRNRNLISQEVYEQVREHLHKRIVELDREELEGFMIKQRGSR